jgi:hypothetical protein
MSFGPPREKLPAGDTRLQTVDDAVVVVVLLLVEIQQVTARKERLSP